MKTKIINFGHDCWHMLTEVPGWPDAPKQVRLRRSLPILLPCVAILLLLTWNNAVRNPAIARERTSHQALVAQEQEIDLLRVNCSDQQAEELSARAASAAKLLLNDPQEVAPFLAILQKQAADRHWNGTFRAEDVSTDVPETDTNLFFLQAKAKLTSSPGKSDAFPALLALFEQFSTAEKRIDLTRLGIRADEQGRHTVEFNLRLMARRPHAKTP